MPHKNTEERKAYHKAYREANKEKRTEYSKSWYQANKEKILEQKKAYREANKEKIAKQKKSYEKQKRKSNSFFRLTLVCKQSCRRAFYSIGQKKNNSSLKLLGLKTWQQLAKHLSKQFYNHPKTGEEMTFDNHGVYGWHIDHIIPLSTAETEEDIIKLCHYTNLQPLWAEENKVKSNKILDAQ